MNLGRLTPLFANLKKHPVWLRLMVDKSSKPSSEGSKKEKKKKSKEEKDEPCPSRIKRHALVNSHECERITVCPDEPLALCDKDCPPRVLIVGAGVAGLAAASRLLSCGVKDVKVIEAKDRPGGRVHTCLLGKQIIELGAEYIEGGCIANPIYQLACMEGLLPDPSHRYNNTNGVFITSDGRPLEAQPSVFTAMDRVFNEAAQAFLMSKETNQGLLKLVHELVEKELSRWPDWDRADALRMMYGVINERRAEMGEDLSLMRAEQFGSRVVMPGGRLRINSGVVGLIAAMIKNIPKSSIIYCKTVQNIRWRIGHIEGSSNVQLKCCDGTEYNGDFVIVTVSLGVLKTQADKMFCPSLPEDKINAITNIPMGNISKIFLEYGAPFWVKNNAVMRFAWSPEELKSREDWVKGIGIIEEVPGSKNLLKVTVGGKEAIILDRCTEAEVGTSLTRWLRDITGDKTLPYPITVAKSSWNSDLFTAGSSSLPSVPDQCTLATPLPGPNDPYPPVVLFAGEATVPGFQGTMHAAYMSGVREADRLLAVINQQSEKVQEHKTENPIKKSAKGNQ